MKNSLTTYQSLLPLSDLFSTLYKNPSDVEIIEEFMHGQKDLAISYVYCKHYRVFKITTDKFYGLQDSDIESFILEEIVKALPRYDVTSQVKLSTFISKYIYNRLRTETEYQSASSRVTLNYSCGFEDLAQEDRIEELSEEASYNYCEMYQMIQELDLTEKERLCCHIIIKSQHSLNNAEIGRMMGVTRAGVKHIKTSLQKKLGQVFHVA